MTDEVYHARQIQHYLIEGKNSIFHQRSMGSLSHSKGNHKNFFPALDFDGTRIKYGYKTHFIASENRACPIIGHARKSFQTKKDALPAIYGQRRMRANALLFEPKSVNPAMTILPSLCIATA